MMADPKISRFDARRSRDYIGVALLLAPEGGVWFGNRKAVRYKEAQWRWP